MAPKRQKPERRRLEDTGKTPKAGISMLQERLIGRVIVAWSHLDAAMEDAVWKILRLPMEDGRVFTARADSNTKIQWLRYLSARHTGGLDPAEIDRLLSTMDELRDDRNFIAHGAWGSIQPDNVPAAMSLRTKLEPDRIACETFPERRMRKILADTHACAVGLKTWMDALSTSRETPLPRSNISPSETR